MAQIGALGIFDHNELEKLRKNYLFLRNLESSLRILNSSYTNHLPEESSGLLALAIFLGYKKSEMNDQAKILMNDYFETTKLVRSFYRKTIDSLLRFSL